MSISWIPQSIKIPPDALAYATKKPEGSYASHVIDFKRNGTPAEVDWMWAASCDRAVSTVYLAVNIAHH